MKIFFAFFFISYVSLAQDTIDVCSFNIQFLGHFKSRDNAMLADVLKSYDLVAIEEMVAPPIEGVYPDGTPFHKDNESAAFAAEMKKHGFSYWLSTEDTGPTKNHTPTTASEWWIVFYKNNIVVPDSNRYFGFISSPLAANPIFARVPFAFPFKAVKGSLNFSIVPVHLQPGDSKAEEELRKQELQSLYEWSISQKESNKDFLILGDFNIYDISEFSAYKDKGFYSLNEKCLSTNSLQYDSPAKGEPYDHVFYGKNSQKDIVSGSFKIIDLQTELLKLSKNTLHLTPYVHDDFRTLFSDHLPVKFQLITGRDNDL